MTLKYKMQDAHRFWRNPQDVSLEVPDLFRGYCGQDYYLTPHNTRKMWLKIFKKYVSPEDSILELGCSVGRNLHHLYEAGYKNLKGVEISEKAKPLAQENFPEIAEFIETSSIEDWLKRSTQKFDVIFTSGVFMHVHPDSDWIFKEVADRANKYIFSAEVEAYNDSILRFNREYKKIFTKLGLRQVFHKVAETMSSETILRVFKK